MRIMDKLMLQRDPAVNLVPWLNEVRLFKGVVTSIINLPSQDKLSTESRYIIFNFAHCLAMGITARVVIL